VEKEIGYAVGLGAGATVASVAVCRPTFEAASCGFPFPWKTTKYNVEKREVEVDYHPEAFVADVAINSGIAYGLMKILG